MFKIDKLDQANRNTMLKTETYEVTKGSSWPKWFVVEHLTEQTRENQPNRNYDEPSAHIINAVKKYNIKYGKLQNHQWNI